MDRVVLEHRHEPPGVEVAAHVDRGDQRDPAPGQRDLAAEGEIGGRDRRAHPELRAIAAVARRERDRRVPARGLGEQQPVPREVLGPAHRPVLAEVGRRREQADLDVLAACGR